MSVVIPRRLPPARAAYDVVVVGGGITGVHLAREAAARGLAVLLAERRDYGCGTSSATTKYIHGGLRYLEQRQLRVVRESLKERRVLGLAAPHLVQPRMFVLPVWRWSRPPVALLGAGVGLYDVLGFDRNRGVPRDRRVPRGRWAGRGEVLRRVPWLDPRELRGGFLFTDFLNVHPERLLLTLLKGAVAAGAEAVNHAAVVRFLRGPSAVTGVVIRDELTGAEHEVRATVVVNAAGPWAGELLRLPGGAGGTAVRTSKGVHLLLRALPGDDPVLARTRDGRHVVVSPWQGCSLVGPTDDEVDGPVDGVTATADDVASLLSTLNSASTDPRTPADVEAVTVGVRPLVAGHRPRGGGSSYTASRRAEWIDHRAAGTAGLWTVTGGKWTTARATAEGLVRALTEPREAPLRRAAGRRPVPLDPYGPWPGASTAPVGPAPLTARDAEHLQRLYGAEAAGLMARVEAEPALAQRLSSRPRCPDVAVQVVHGVEAEGARTLDDLVDRRLVLGTLGPPTAEELLAVASVAAPLLGWSPQDVSAAVADRLDRDRAVVSAVSRDRV